MCMQNINPQSGALPATARHSHISDKNGEPSQQPWAGPNFTFTRNVLGYMGGEQRVILIEKVWMQL